MLQNIATVITHVCQRAETMDKMCDSRYSHYDIGHMSSWLWMVNLSIRLHGVRRPMFVSFKVHVIIN